MKKKAVRVNTDNFLFGKDIRRRIESEFRYVETYELSIQKDMTSLEDGMLMVVYTIKRLLIEIHLH